MTIKTQILIAKQQHNGQTLIGIRFAHDQQDIKYLHLYE
jgi:hypothetical protein